MSVDGEMEKEDGGGVGSSYMERTDIAGFGRGAFYFAPPNATEVKMK